MRIAVVGATGRIGRRTVEAIRRAGHDPLELSRSHGVDVFTGDGLRGALAGADVVVDASNTSETDPDRTVEFFRTSSANLVAAELAAGVKHHVLLSIVGIDRVEGNAHYAGKLAQEERVLGGGVPYTIVRATQFYDFPIMVTSWASDGDSAVIAPLLMQPIAPGDVAEALTRTALGDPSGRLEIAGPEPQDLIDLARRTLAARGEALRLVPSWRGLFGTQMAGEVLLPGPDTQFMATTFDEWLQSGAALD